MKILPWMMRIRITGRGFWMPTLWLPLFLLWPLVLLLAIPVFLLAIIVVLIFDTRSIGRLMKLFKGLYLTLCELRGMLIDVSDPKGCVSISIL